jgi:putative membrane protein
MPDTSEKPKPKGVPDRRDHLANERTFLAWVRTSIGIMAFGFVVEKFALFMRRLPFLFGEAKTPAIPASPLRYSTVFGILLVAMGALMGLLAFIRYKKVEREIYDDTYRPSMLLDIMVAIGILAIGIFLVFYMIHSI